MTLVIDNPELEARLQEKGRTRGLSVDAYLSEREREDDVLQEARIRELRQRMDASLAAMENGEGTEGEEFMAGLIGELDAEQTRSAE